MAKDLTDALAALTEQAQGNSSRRDKKLPAVKDPDPIPERTGVPKTKTSTGGGSISSPLTETDYTAREYHPTSTMSTTDGIFWARVKPIKTIKFTDANNSELVMIYQQPV